MSKVMHFPTSFVFICIIWFIDADFTMKKFPDATSFVLSSLILNALLGALNDNIKAFIV